MLVHMRYFASLREAIGIEAETISLPQGVSGGSW